MNTQSQPAAADLSQDISDWPGSPLSTIHEPEPVQQPIRTEEYPHDGRYIVRFELPGIDGSGIDVSIENRELTVHAERPGGSSGKDRTDFRYGEFTSHVTLPPGMDDSDVTAIYLNGILEVTVGFEDRARHAAHQVPVRVGDASGGHHV
jgi:HSP20 family protein